MPSARLVRTLPVVLCLAACSRATTRDTEVAEPGPTAARTATDEEPEASEVEETDARPAVPKPKGAQEITFGDDEMQAEPTTQVRGAPKRPTIPRFQLFGTRPSDGPQ